MQPAWAVWGYLLSSVLLLLCFQNRTKQHLFWSGFWGQWVWLTLSAIYYFEEEPRGNLFCHAPGAMGLTPQSSVSDGKCLKSSNWQLWVLFSWIILQQWDPHCGLEINFGALSLLGVILPSQAHFWSFFSLQHPRDTFIQNDVCAGGYVKKADTQGNVGRICFQRTSCTTLDTCKLLFSILFRAEESGQCVLLSGFAYIPKRLGGLQERVCRRWNVSRRFCSPRPGVCAAS